MSYISDRVETVLAMLQAKKTRCTYGALAELVGTNPRDVSVYLTPRRAEASWVVSKKTGLPTGYESYQLHPELEKNEHVIGTGKELESVLSG
jgi:alkylated DNA nucleotide flippase Atl1